MVGPEISRRLPNYPQFKISLANAFGVSVMLFGSLLHNYSTKRPMNASYLKHVAAIVVGLYAGSHLGKVIDGRRNETVLVIEDYICRHPEDFPIVTPKKYKDLLLPWHPGR
uniref:WIF domain-containing protein n=1 Tax=Arion vulgaris TaxID=1028688 RepID=A0A0B7BDF3_9EUPU